MSIIGGLLFYNSKHADIGDLARHNIGKLREAVNGVSQNVFDAKSDAEVVDLVIKEMRVDPLVVHFDAAQKDVQETTMEIRDDFGFGDGPIQVPALRATKSMPFSGDRNLWEFMTGSWSTSMPQGEVTGNRLIVGMIVRADRAAEAKAHIDRTIEEIKGYVTKQRAQIDAYNDSLPGHILPLVEERRKRRGAASALLNEL